MSNDLALKREKEKKIVEEMIVIYCKKNHKPQAPLCLECTELRDYAFARADKCPFMKNKTFCSNCKVHCYEPAMREEIRLVMRFSGKRLVFRRPFLVIKHMILFLAEKRRLAKTGRLP